MGSSRGRRQSSAAPDEGSGAAEALLLAEEGAKVIVNDVGGARAGEGKDVTRPSRPCRTSWPRVARPSSTATT